MKKALLLLALFVAGCGSVNPITVARLARLSPETADPANFQVMLLMPDELKVPPGGAALRLSAKRDDTGEALDQDIILRDQDAVAADTDRPARLFSIAPADLPRVRDFQSRIAAWKSAAPDATHGSMSVGVSACRTCGGPAPDARVSTRIRIQPDGPFLPLATNVPVAEILKQAGAGDADDAIQPCEKPLPAH